jgi:hypothetical protein
VLHPIRARISTGGLRKLFALSTSRIRESWNVFPECKLGRLMIKPGCSLLHCSKLYDRLQQLLNTAFDFEHRLFMMTRQYDATFASHPDERSPIGFTVGLFAVCADFVARRHGGVGRPATHSTMVEFLFSERGDERCGR